MDSIKESFHCRILCDIKPVNAGLFKDVFCVVPNLMEAIQLVDVSDDYALPDLASKIKNKLCLDAIVITLSENGIFLLDQYNKSHSLKAHHTNSGVLDVTGAGDTVISTLAACLATGYSLFESAVLANLAAAIVVRKIGTATCSARELFDAHIQL